MKKSIAILTIVILGVNYSCNISETKSDNATTQVETQSESKSNEHQHSESDAIELNNGAKWKVVPEMLQYIRYMETDVDHFFETRHSELNDFTRLGGSLKKNIDLLTSNCTMEGKAHDELHKWLLPYIAKVDELNQSKNSDEASHIFDELKSSFKTFNTYFE